MVFGFLFLKSNLADSFGFSLSFTNFADGFLFLKSFYLFAKTLSQYATQMSKHISEKKMKKKFQYKKIKLSPRN